MINIEENKNIAIGAYTLASLFSVIYAYDLLGFTQGIYSVMAVLVIGIVSGFRAMHLIKPMVYKIIVAVPIALNSIVFLYFSGMAVIYFVDVK